MKLFILSFILSTISVYKIDAQNERVSFFTINQGATFLNSPNLILKGSMGQNIIHSIKETNIINNQGFWNIWRQKGATTSTPTRTKDFLSLKVYPNPLIESFNIEFESNVHSSLDYDVYDMYGRRIKRGIVKGNQANNIYIPNLSSGTYILMIKTKTLNEFIKLIKM